MNTSLRSFRAVALAVTLVLGLTLPVLAGSPGLEVGEITFQGNVLRVAVTNSTDTPLSGSLVARVALDTGPTALLAPVRLEEGQKAFVEIHAPSTIEGVIQVGVVLDDGSPF